MILKDDGDAMPRVTKGRDHGTVYINVNFSYPPHLALLYQVDSFHEDPRAYYHPISLYMSTDYAFQCLDPVLLLCLTKSGPLRGQRPTRPKRPR